jgi:rhamnosyltransferase subunit B
MRIILAAFGSYGDIKPFLWLGKALRKSGHEIVFIANPFFGNQVEDEGFEFRPAGTLEEYRAAATPAKSTGNRFHDKGERIAASRRLFNSMFLQPSKATFDIISEYKADTPVIIGHFYAYGAKLAAEKFGLPFLNVCLSTYWLRNFIKPSNLSSAVGKFAAEATTRFIDGQLFTKPFNALRADIGLAPMRKSSARWMFEEDTLCLFPKMLLDFSLEPGIRVEIAGFPLEGGAGSLPEETAAFLEKYGKPVVFTPGSAVTDTGPFFREALKALQALGKPGIFLSRSVGDLPDLPETVMHAAYLPLELLLDKCSAIVHHGGIGTAAQALASGTPQLICTRMAEQQENARVLERLGVCRALPFDRLNADAMVPLLEALTGNLDIEKKCKEMANSPLGCREDDLKNYMQSWL